MIRRRAAAAVALAFLALSQGALAGQAAPAQDEVMTSTSEPDLRRRIAIPGQPRSVLWAAETVTPASPDSFPPGPSDTRLRAVLTYGSADEVAAIVGDGPAQPAEIEAPDWFPATLHPGGSLGVVRHHRVPGLEEVRVMTIPGAGGVILLEKGPA